MLWRALLGASALHSHAEHTATSTALDIFTPSIWALTGSTILF
jgi:hypothetical protein